MLAAPVNPADLLVLEGRYPHPVANGSVLGAEGVGCVVDVGPDITDIAPGQLALPLDRGNWASHRLVAADRLIPVSPDIPLTHQQLATLRINPATAWRLLDNMALKAGDWIVQSAAGSFVARAVCVFAATRGIGVVNVVRNPAHYPGLANVIADDPTRSATDFAAQVKHITGHAPVRLALDAVAGETSGRLAACLAHGGLLRVYGHLSGHPCSVPSALLTGGGLRIDGFTLRRAESDAGIAELRQFYDRLLAVMTDKDLWPAGAWPVISATHHLTDLGNALRAARSGLAGPGGRVFLTLS